MFSLLEKFKSSLSGTKPGPELSSEPSPAYGQLPAGLNHREDALKRIAREDFMIEQLRADLLRLKPDERKTVDKLASNFHQYARTGVLSQEGYGPFRTLYRKTHGESNTLIGRHLSKLFPKPALPAAISSALGDFTDSDIRGIASQLTANGVARLDRKLSPELVRELNQSMDAEASKNEGAGYEKENAARTVYRETALLASAPFRKLGSDPLFYFVASEYLQVEPILGQLSAWISSPHVNDQGTLSKSAQLFHFDMSHPNFLKVFIYLNDVGEKNGPHCLVRGTHREKVPALWKDGRVGDEEMALHYPVETWDNQIGEAGSVFFVDTKAFHKGVPLLEGNRHLAQFYYVDTLFGEPAPLGSGAPEFDPEKFGEQIREYTPRFFERYALASSD